MTSSLSLSLPDLMGLAPMGLVFAMVLVLLVWPRIPPRWTLPGLALAALVLWIPWDVGESVGASSVSPDRWARIFQLLLLAAGAVAMVLGPLWQARNRAREPEYGPLVLLSLVGMMGMVLASDLLLLFVALEIMSLAAYVLAALRRAHVASVQAGVRYFVLGAFSSALLLYGVALVYGAVGSTAYGAMRAALESTVLPAGEPALHLNHLLTTGVALVLVGFSFKMALVPFHLWAPDVYQDVPTPVTGFFAMGVKTATVGALGRFLMEALQPRLEVWSPALMLLALATLTVGSVATLFGAHRPQVPQGARVPQALDLKRWIGWLSIGSAGFLLLPLVSLPQATGWLGAVPFYLCSWILALTVILSALSPLAGDGASLDRLRGLGHRRPLLAAALVVALLSVAGVPLTAGFPAKLFLFLAALAGGHWVLVVVAALCAVVVLGSVLRPIAVLVMASEESPAPEGEPELDGATRALVILASLGILLLGVAPGLLGLVEPG